MISFLVYLWVDQNNTHPFKLLFSHHQPLFNTTTSIYAEFKEMTHQKKYRIIILLARATLTYVDLEILFKNANSSVLILELISGLHVPPDWTDKNANAAFPASLSPSESVPSQLRTSLPRVRYLPWAAATSRQSSLEEMLPSVKLIPKEIMRRTWARFCTVSSITYSRKAEKFCNSWH